MRSPTQRELHIEDIAALIRRGLDSTVVNAAELTGGGFAAVWRASLADGRDVVVKVGPPAEAKLLGYGYDFEQATHARVLPKNTPALKSDQIVY